MPRNTRIVRKRDLALVERLTRKILSAILISPTKAVRYAPHTWIARKRDDRGIWSVICSGATQRKAQLAAKQWAKASAESYAIMKRLNPCPRN